MNIFFWFVICLLLCFFAIQIFLLEPAVFLLENINVVNDSSRVYDAHHS